MAEILADTVRHAVARLAGHTLEGHRQSAAGQRPGVETAKSFYYDTDCTVYHNGIPETIPALMRASVYLSGGTTFNLKTSRWISFTIVGSGQHYITPQQNWPSVFAAVDAIGIEYHTRAGWRRYVPNSLSIVPPPPPIVIITSTDGGEDLTTGFGSNPYHLGVPFQALTKTVSNYFFGNGADHSNTHHPGPPDGGLPPAAMYPVGTPDWHLLAFPGAGTDHWPLLSWPTIGTGGLDNPGDWPGWYTWWPSWRTPVFGVTAYWTGHGTRFDPAMIWDSANDVAPFLYSNSLTHDFVSPPGTIPTSIQEDICIRGDLSLPPLPAGTSVLSITWNSFVSNSFHAADTYLNDANLSGFFSGIGTDPAGLLNGLDISSTASTWVWGGYNLLTMLASVLYVTGQLQGGAWVNIDFVLDNGTHWAPPPADWQDGGGTFTTAVEGAPIAYFGRGVTNSIDFGNIGAGSREYFRHTFTIPAGTIHDGTLALTAETGIGSIYLNGHLIDAHDETIDLYSSMTTLTYTIPATYLIAGGSNIIAIQCYSITGECRLMYQIIVR